MKGENFIVLEASDTIGGRLKKTDDIVLFLLMPRKVLFCLRDKTSGSSLLVKRSVIGWNSHNFFASKL